MAQWQKNLSTNVGDVGLITGLERCPGEENGNPVFLPGKSKSHGQKSQAVYSPLGCKKVRYDLASKQQQSMS